MASRDVTIWICDRCRVEVEHRGAPAGWHSVSSRLMGEDLGQEIEVCKQCFDDISWTINNVVRAAGDE